MSSPEGEVMPLDVATVEIRRIEPLFVLAIRHLPDAADEVEAALRSTGLPGLPWPGQVLGRDPWILWRSPSELMLLSTTRTGPNALTDAIGNGLLACAVEQSDGLIGFELRGAQVDEMLRRLVDHRSVPGSVGSAARVRLADIAVVLLRVGTDKVWLLADRGYEHYLRAWFNYLATISCDR